MVNGMAITNLKWLAEGGYINYDPGEGDGENTVERNYLGEFQAADNEALKNAEPAPEGATHSVIAGTPSPEDEDNDLEVRYI